MNRFVIALGIAIATAGCAAEAIEDPAPEVLATEPQREPPRQRFYGELYDPYWENIAVDLDDYRPDLEVPPRQIPDEVWPYLDP